MTEFWDKPAEKSGKVLAAFLEGLPLTLTTIKSMQPKNKQASRLPHVHTTMEPSSKMIICKMYSSPYQSVK
jgi:hypothetical protein